MTMAQETLQPHKASTQSADAHQTEHRRELKQLLGTLKSELVELSRTHSEHAQSITGFARVASHEAARTAPNPRLLKHAQEGLKASVEEFEVSHPRLVQTVGALATLLASMGV